MTIWRYQLQVKDSMMVNLRVGAKIMTIALQDGIPTLWAMCDPNAPMSCRLIVCRGTGFEFAESDVGIHLGTVVTADGFVWHYFDRGEQ